MADRRIQKSKDAIMAAFVKLMNEMTFEQITINQVAERANVNRGTVYLHYTDKHDLLDKCVDTHLRRVFEMCMPDDGQHGEISNNDLILGSLTYIQQDSAFFHTMLSNKGGAAFRGRLQDMLQSRIEEIYQTIELEEQIQKGIFTQFLASAIIGLLEWWIINSFPYSPGEMVDQIGLLLKRFQLEFPPL